MISAIVSDYLNLAYLILPKCGCTSVKSYICTADLNVPLSIVPGCDTASLEGIFGPYTSRYIKPSLIKDGRDIISFTFVRNPVSRIISLYKEKVFYSFYDPMQKFGVYYRMPLDDFVDIIVDVSDIDADDHFRSQYSMVAENDKIEIDYVAAIEHINLRMPQLLEYVGSPWVGDLFRHRETTGKGIGGALSDASVNKILSRYSNDLWLHEQAFKAPLLRSDAPIVSARWKEAGL